MAREDRERDEVRQRVEQASPGEVVPGLDAEEEASAEASQRPGPWGRIGGIDRGESGAGKPDAGKSGGRTPEGEQAGTG
jgi:hypothetical protein